MGLCRAVYGEDFAPEEVSFSHPAPSCRADYSGLFRCPVQFDAAVPEIVLDRALAEAPLPTENKELALANDAILAAYVGELSASDIVSRVKAAVVEHLPSGAPNAGVVAKDVYMSTRTLHRKLSAEGTTYAQVLEAVRRTLAEQYIADPRKTLGEITFLSMVPQTRA